MGFKVLLRILVFSALGLSTPFAGQSANDPQTESASLPDSARTGFLAETSSPVSAYREHAPLALFSVGSLAVGGIFYGIQSQLGQPHVGYVASGQGQMTTAIAAAGITALVAGVSYFYFSHRDEQKAHDWDAQVSGGVAPDGDVSIAARLTLPVSLPSF